MSTPKVGAYAGWYLDFRKGPDETAEVVLGIGSSDYYASIDATLPAGLDGGSYTFVVEGITNEDYAALYRTLSAADSQLVVRLYLYWRDTGVVGYLVDLAGLSDAIHGDQPPTKTPVAVLRVTALKRRAGSRRYEVVIEAREWVYDRALRRIAKGDEATDPLTAAHSITLDTNIGITLIPMGEVKVPEGETLAVLERNFATGDVALTRLRALGNAMARLTNSFGIDMYLIREGILYAGPDRHDAGVDHEDDLTPDTGIIQVEARGQESTDPNWVATPEVPKEPRRDLFELTLRGRPDIKPGDFVRFTKPVEESDDVGTPASFSLDVLSEVKGGAKAKMYVRGVVHRLTRETGFVTVLRGFSVPGGKETAWFRHSPPKGPAVPSAAISDDSPDGALSGTLREMFEQSGGQRVEVAQVREANVQQGNKLPTQTEKLWRGLVADDGHPYAAARLAHDDKMVSRFGSAPYASPFAWGKFGLVLPRYPGTRVVVAHRLGDTDDPVDIGALWPRGQAPASKPGDYWLILPAAITETDRASVGDHDPLPEPAGLATNDLIDADGNRVIEVGTLTVRVGTALLTEGGTRPDPGANQVHIQHESGARITIDQDGNVTIHAKKKLTLSAEDDVVIDTPGKVIVQTGEHMDVKGRST